MLRDEALRRAAQLVPVLRERAARCEDLREVPPETVKDIVASGLIRVGNPERYGGCGLDIDTVHEIAFELGRGCGSTAWCASLWITHNWWIGHFPERVQHEFFATGPDTIYSTGLNPAAGTATPVTGGVRISGRWSFSSGCDAAQWAMVATGTLLEPMWSLLPRSDYEIVDTWFASGLRGSGSKDIVVRDAFVPAHRSVNPNRAGESDLTGWEIHKRVSYRVPLRALTEWDLSAPIVGMAQGMIDTLAERHRGTASPPMQLRLAEASAEVDAARALQRHDVREILDRSERGAPLTALDRARYRRDKGFVPKLCVQAVNRLFEAGGARAVLDTDPVQRFHRDAHAASHHAGLSWDLGAGPFGAALTAP